MGSLVTIDPGPWVECPVMSDSCASACVILEDASIILMSRPESPALVHGRLAADAHPALAALYTDEDGPTGQAVVVRENGQVIARAHLATPVVLDLDVIIGLTDDEASGLERRPSAMVMIYPDDDCRAAGLADFRSGGVRGDWVRLGIILPNASTDALRA